MDSYFHNMVDKALKPNEKQPIKICRHRAKEKQPPVQNQEEIPLHEQTDEQLRHNIAQIQRGWYEHKGTPEEHKKFDAILDEILRRRAERARQ